MEIWRLGQELGLHEVGLPLVSGWPDAHLEVEIGFGKGGYLIGEAERFPQRRYLGIEAARAYWRTARRRAQRRGLANLTLVCGEALYVASVCLEAACARAVHVYFPDPWPKSRHQKRRLLELDTTDIVLGLLAPGGRLYFATDHLEYGESVAELFDRHAAVAVERLRGPWPEGPRTNYEKKYLTEGRRIVRLVVTRSQDASSKMLRPQATTCLAAGFAL